MLENGKTKAMSEITIGDRVQVGDNRFSEVYMFSHHIPESKAKFVELKTASMNTLRLTESHYLYVN